MGRAFLVAVAVVVGTALAMCAIAVLIVLIIVVVALKLRAGPRFGKLSQEQNERNDRSARYQRR
jgi:hypothetical protein